MHIALLFLILFFSSSGTADTLAAFTSDGCSLFPEGTTKQKKLWISCCTEHDKAYWKGGTYNDRLKADRSLKECVSSAGQPKIANLMLAGVRIGGSPYLPTSFRWGYGWPYLRTYRELTEQEIEQVNYHNKNVNLLLIDHKD